MRGFASIRNIISGFFFFFSERFELVTLPLVFCQLMQMKSNIIQLLSAVQVDTVVRVQQVSNVIAFASSVIDEVTVEAQVI